MRAQADVFRQRLPEPVQGMALVQLRHAATGEPEAFAAAEGHFSGEQVLKVDAAPAVVVEDKFLILNLQINIARRFPAGAEDTDRSRGAGPVTAVGAGEDKGQRAGQGKIGLTGQDFGAEERVDRRAVDDVAGADGAGDAGGGANHHAHGTLHNRAAEFRHVAHAGSRFSTAHRQILL
ncbi:hypothetical protein CIT292_08901 [Citrobacter youngae ATCC 29220]|uniref:Uncharacterized protein n=1 Tax=Citrobacter youngae ATCC 29220 TaxID=500640 RepID=D4BEG8_9ENTR|nr:hypothetical protein CIT292_08901 [Citrobacter youngae ATCC 29220]